MRLGIFFGLALLLAGLTTPSIASTINGRIMTGGYAARETLADIADGQSRNDSAVFSSRLFLQATEVGQSKVEYTADVRDKHDFFEKLDRERLELTPQNTFQMRQISARQPRLGADLYFEAGRFAIPDAGAVFVDGAEFGHHWTSSWKSSLFAGLNPKRLERSDLVFDRNSSVAGTYSVYQPRAQDWDRNTYWANAFVLQRRDANLDRVYWFHRFIYQWSQECQVSGAVFWDFVPRSYIQSGNMSWQQKWTERFSTDIVGTVIDVIEYSHRQGVLERLTPSPYKEAETTLRQKVGADTLMEYRAAYGVRQYDGLTKAEGAVGPTFLKLFDPHFTAQFLIGMRRDFGTQDRFFKMGVGYYSQLWELSLRQELEVQKQSDSSLLHPVVTEVTAARYFSNALFMTVSMERANNENVNIWSGFFKLGYRFGTEKIAPLREGTPQRGPL